MQRPLALVGCFFVAAIGCASRSPATRAAAGSGSSVGEGSDAPLPATPRAELAEAPGSSRLFAANRQTCVVRSDETSCWGYNGSRQLFGAAASNEACGGGNGNRCRLSPERIAPLRGLRDLAFGDEHACAIGASGAVTCWGDASYLVANPQGTEPCGSGRRCRTVPIEIAVANAVQVASGIDTSCARTNSGEVWCWGWNDLGQVGDGTTTGTACSGGVQRCRLVPKRVAGIAHAAELVMGARHACARLDDGTVRCWGEDESGQLGDSTLGERCGKSLCRPAPVLVTGLDHVVKVAAGYRHTCAVRDDGTVRCWGLNDLGRLGDGAAVGAPCGFKNASRCRLAPVFVVGLSKIVDVAAGADFTCARSSEGKVFCWGQGLGVGPKGPHSGVPKVVEGIADAVLLGAGAWHACALDKAGALACWGRNTFGQLGDGTVEDRTAPTAVKR